jgi:hypothetical protein
MADNTTETRHSDQAIYEFAQRVMFDVRKDRSEQKQPLKVPITRVTVNVDTASAELMPIVDADLRAALRVKEFRTVSGEGLLAVVEGYETLPQG